MTFVYALVAKNQTPLADYSSFEGNFKTFALKMLEGIEPQDHYTFSEQGEYIFNASIASDRLVFLVLTSKNVAQPLRISFLEELERKWRARYGNKSASFQPYSKSIEFGADIQVLFSTYNSERAQKLGKIREDIAKSQEITSRNLTLALARGEQLEIMSQKAEILKDSTTAFHREATKVKKAMFCQKWRNTIIFVLFLLVIIAVTIGIIVALTKKKKSKNDDQNNSSALLLNFQSYLFK